VLRWERRWDEAGQPFIDPASFPALSCALTGTHDTDTLADWWDAAPHDERAALLELPILRDGGFDPGQPWSPALGDAMLALTWTCGSTELFATIQDLFGWRARVNLPGTVGPHNWTWRMPQPVDRLGDAPEAQARAGYCRAITERWRKG
jgi:4-alpha-glucanotransferase